jgi:hypothetical protein
VRLARRAHFQKMFLVMSDEPTASSSTGSSKKAGDLGRGDRFTFEVDTAGELCYEGKVNCSYRARKGIA